MLKDVRNPFGISLVGFLVSNRFYIFGVSQNNVAGRFQNVVDGNPILSCGFHAHILAVVLSQPSRTPPQISGESGKALTLVACYALLIGGSDTGDDKGFVDIHPTADTVYDFEHNTSPRNNI